MEYHKTLVPTFIYLKYIKTRCVGTTRMSTSWILRGLANNLDPQASLNAQDLFKETKIESNI